MPSTPHTQVYDLTNCAKEPIHIPGSIQPHGILLGLSEPDLRVRVSSQSAVGIICPTLDELIDSVIDEWVNEETRQLVRSVGSLADPIGRGPLRFTTINGTTFDAAIHRSQGLLLIELEPLSNIPERVVELPHLLTLTMAEIRSTVSIEAIAQFIALRVRELSGYDRCMVYRFDARANGEVIGEAKRPDLVSYLGLHYPEADIPPQARRLYKTNTIRLIVDVEYEPSPLEPSCNPYTGQPVDLSRSLLRSVSSLHRDYLKNMGVRATLTLSLMVRGELWGLVVCHHYNSPRHIRPELRSTCEALALFLAQRISELEQQQAQLNLSTLRTLTHRLSQPPDLNVDNPQYRSDLAAVCELLRCRTLVWWNPEGSTVLTGVEISHAGLAHLVQRLDALDTSQYLESDCLVEFLGGDPIVTRDFAGMLAVQLTSRGSWLMALRGEQIHEVTWGSAALKKVELRQGVPRLSPEGSFGLWKETVRNRCRPWSDLDRQLFLELRDFLRAREAARMAEYAVRVRELKRVADAKDDFLAQLSHELRNPLNAILGWADILSHDTNQLPERARRGLEVIERNARVQARLIDDLLDVSRIVKGSLRLELQAQTIEPVLRAALESVQSAASAKSVRINTIIDPATAPVNGDADRLQQVIWNLLSNAVKFTPKDGSVTITLKEQDSSILLSVDNTGSAIEPDVLPFIFDRFRQGVAGSRSRMGLGLGLAIAKGIVELHGGQLSAENTHFGVRFTVRLPVLAYKATSGSVAPESPPPYSIDPLLLSGARVLLVDDEPEAIEVLREVLSRAGAKVEAYNSPVELLAKSALEVDVLVSDLGMPEMTGTELIRALRVRGFAAPALALSAYTTRNHQLAALRAGFNLHVPKPVDGEQLLTSIGSLLGRFHDEI